MKAGLEPGRNRELSGARERLEGVLHQVEEHLCQLRAVTAHRGQARIEGGPESDGAPVRGLALEAEDGVQHAMDVDRLELELRRYGELAQLLDQAVEPLHLADDDLRAADEIGIRDGAPQELCRTLDPTEGVLDLVREAEGDGAERREAVGPRGRRLERALEAQVVEDEHRPAEPAVPVEDGSARGAHRRLAAPRDERALAVPTGRTLTQRAPRELAEPVVPAARTELADLHPDRLRVRHAEELLGGGVQIGDPARRIEHDHAILEARQHVHPRRARRVWCEGHRFGGRAQR